MPEAHGKYKESNEGWQEIESRSDSSTDIEKQYECIKTNGGHDIFTVKNATARQTNTEKLKGFRDHEQAK